MQWILFILLFFKFWLDSKILDLYCGLLDFYTLVYIFKIHNTNNSITRNTIMMKIIVLMYKYHFIQYMYYRGQINELKMAVF